MRVAAADAIPLAPERLKDWLKAGYHLLTLAFVLLVLIYGAVALPVPL